MSVEESRCLGLSWGRKCSVCTVILSLLYLLVTLAYSLTARLYLRGYYRSAHVAGLGAVTGLFVLAHHLCRVRSSFGCCSLQVFAVIQTVMNSLYLLINTVLAAGYILITVTSIHINFDYTVAAVFSCLNVIWTLYLLITSCTATKRDRYMDYEVDVQFVWHSDSLGGIANDMELFGYPAYGDLGTGGKSSSTGTNTSLMTKSSDKKPRSCKACRKCCGATWNLIFTVFYTLTQIIIVLIFALSACHPVFVAVDTYQYRNQSDLYTVTVNGHRPLAMFLKCRGSGNQTIVFENGLGSVAYMNWHFIPRFLEDQYRVCVIDRRGLGWSETYEHDHISLLRDRNQQQWSLTNAEFTATLVQQAGIDVPFYYIGHSYGGHHLVQLALHHPQLVKALVFLDSSELSVADTVAQYAELVANFDAMGLVYIITESGWLDLEEIFQDIVELGVLPTDIRQQLYASLRSGYYFTALSREYHGLIGDEDFGYTGIRAALKDKVIDLPVFVIDAGDRVPDWFPESHFPQYNTSVDYVSVPGATHSNLVAGNRYGKVTSQLIDAFIQHELGYINQTEFITETDRSRKGS